MKNRELMKNGKGKNGLQMKDLESMGHLELLN